MKKLLRDILFMQSFGIILVVLGHSFFQFSHHFIVLRWIYGFHMPMFFFISGYLLRYAHGNLKGMRLVGHGGYLTRRAHRLLLPYVVLSTLVFIPKTLMSNYTVRVVHLNWHEYLYQLLYPYHNVLAAFWFMPTLFLTFAVFIIGCMLAHKVCGRLTRCHTGMGVLVLLALLNCLIPFSHDSLFNCVGVAFYMFHFTLGYLFQASPLETAVKNANPLMLFVATLTMSVVLLYVPQNSFVDLLTALNGTLMTMALALLYERHNCHLLDHLYGYTYTIYLFSNFFQIICLQLALHFVSLPPAVFVPMSFLTGLYGPVAMRKVWRKMKSQKSA